jgi:hypothetical protein
MNCAQAQRELLAPPDGDLPEGATTAALPSI